MLAAACSSKGKGGPRQDGVKNLPGVDAGTDAGAQGSESQSSSSDQAPTSQDSAEIPNPGSETSSSGPSDKDCNKAEKEPYDFSLIWIANSPEGTVSKIDTRSGKEVARYRTGPTAESNPSRTSVSLEGFVAVANRKGSVTVIAPREAKCIDRNKDGVIQTSRSPQELLAWGEDECVLWRHELTPVFGDVANSGGPRAIAWGLREGDADPCGDELADLWVGYRINPSDEVAVTKLSAKGEVLDEARVPNWKANWGHGFYGGVIDPKGNFWGLGTMGTLVKVDPHTMEVSRYEDPKGSANIPYGITADAKGRVWMAGHKSGKLIFFDPSDEQFHEVARANDSGTRYRGLAIGSDQQLWVAVNQECSLARYDLKQNQWIDQKIDLPECEEPVGVGIDAQGKVWVVDKGADRAYIYNPTTKGVEQLKGLNSPYSYSDMTGSGLRLVDNPPPD